MNSWWQLGEHGGQTGKDLAVYQITCPFCMETGKFETAFHAEKKKTELRQNTEFRYALVR